jgi:hypothetical protein
MPADEAGYNGLIRTELLFLCYETFFPYWCSYKKVRAIFNQRLLLTSETVGLCRLFIRANSVQAEKLVTMD